MSPTNHTMPTTERLAIARVIVHQASHSAAQMAQARRDNDAVLAPVRRTIAADVMADMDSATGKPRYTSDHTRCAETERRRALDYGDVLVSFAAFEQRERETNAALDRAYEELYTLRLLVRWETGVLERQTAELLAWHEVAA